MAAVNVTNNTIPACLTTPCAPCYIAAKTTWLEFPYSIVEQPVTVSVVPHITQYPDGSLSTSYSTVKDNRTITLGGNATGSVEYFDDAFTWEVSGLTLTYPTTYAELNNFSGKATADWTLDRTETCQPTKDLTSVALPATADGASLIFPFNTASHKGPAAVPTQVLEYLGSLDEVAQQFEHIPLTSCLPATGIVQPALCTSTTTETITDCVTLTSTVSNYNSTSESIGVTCAEEVITEEITMTRTRATASHTITGETLIRKTAGSLTTVTGDPVFSPADGKATPSPSPEPETSNPDDRNSDEPDGQSSSATTNTQNNDGSDSEQDQSGSNTSNGGSTSQQQVDGSDDSGSGSSGDQTSTSSSNQDSSDQQQQSGGSTGTTTSSSGDESGDQGQQNGVDSSSGGTNTQQSGDQGSNGGGSNDDQTGGSSTENDAQQNDDQSSSSTGDNDDQSGGSTGNTGSQQNGDQSSNGAGNEGDQGDSTDSGSGNSGQGNLFSAIQSVASQAGASQAEATGGGSATLSPEDGTQSGQDGSAGTAEPQTGIATGSENGQNGGAGAGSGSRNTATALPVFNIEGQTLTAGGAATFGGAPVSELPNQDGVVIDGSQIISLADGQATTVLQDGQKPIQVSRSGSAFIVDGQTLSPGQQITAGQTTASLAQSTGVLVVDGTSATLAGPSVTIGGSVYTAVQTSPSGDGLGGYIYSGIGGSGTNDAGASGDPADETGVAPFTGIGSRLELWGCPVWVVILAGAWAL